MEKKFLIYTRAHGCARGGYALWWRPNSAGYTSHIEAAGRYTEKEMLEIQKCRGEDFGIPEEEALEKSHRVVYSDQLEATPWVPSIAESP